MVRTGPRQHYNDDRRTAILKHALQPFTGRTPILFCEYQLKQIETRAMFTHRILLIDPLRWIQSVMWSNGQLYSPNLTARVVAARLSVVMWPSRCLDTTFRPMDLFPASVSAGRTSAVGDGRVKNTIPLLTHWWPNRSVAVPNSFAPFLHDV